MDTTCKAQFLDIWDLHLTKHGGLSAHFERLNAQNQLPSLEKLILEANTIMRRYALDRAFEMALSSVSLEKSPDEYTFITGPLSEASSPDSDSQFTGDQVLANTIAFRRDFLLYIELSDTISEGDMGRVCEVLKVNIFEQRMNIH
jgi:hypothetical protein